MSGQEFAVAAASGPAELDVRRLWVHGARVEMDALAVWR
jgi:hypothetical protein